MENSEIMLNEDQRKTLEKFTNTGVQSARLIRRAKVILALDRSNKKEHLRITRICESEKLSRQSLNVIRKDFLESESIEAFLTRKQRSAPPVEPKITGEVEAYIIALACSEPPSGYAKWTLRLLAKKSVELSYIENISHMSVERVLKKRNLNLI